MRLETHEENSVLMSDITTRRAAAQTAEMERGSFLRVEDSAPYLLGDLNVLYSECRRQRRNKVRSVAKRSSGLPVHHLNFKTPSGVTEAPIESVEPAWTDVVHSVALSGFLLFRMAYPEFRCCFTPGFTRVAPPVLPIPLSGGRAKSEFRL
jgi:hypothetical protein